MFRNAPFSGNISVAQFFGDNSSFFGQFQHQGVSLRGHNGIDFELAVGTAIIAVQSGVVLQADEEPNGFGKYIVLGHEWGQTLYAHLSQINVSINQQVSAGQQIASSGDSGNSSTPQLHFGMRVKPFSLDDGWAGYTDPTPYLERLSIGQGPLIGPHIISSFDDALMARWQPRMILVLDPNPDEMQRLRSVCPNSVIIGRIFVPDQELDSRVRQDPQAAAEWVHEKTMERMNPYVDFWQVTNEILQDDASLSQLNLFEQYRMAHAESAGYRCAIFGFSVGNPDLPEDDRTEQWRKVYQAIERAEQNGHIIALHQYGAPDLQGPAGLADWLIFRLEHQIIRRLPYKKVKFAITEYGIDGMLQGSGPSGWKNYLDAESYAGQLLNVANYLERFSGRVLGYAVFSLGSFAPWESYDIEGSVANLLAERSPRGTWLEVNQSFGGITVPEGDVSIQPAGAGSSSEVGTGTPSTASPPATNPVVVPTAPRTPSTGISPDTSTGGGAPVGGTSSGNTPSVITAPGVTLRVSDAQMALNTKLHGIQERGDYASTALQGDVVYMIQDVFTTRNGSWEPTGESLSVPQWARNDYLKPFGAADWFDDAGADHHIFGAVIGLDGNLIREQEIVFWSDGFDKLGDSNYDGFVSQQTKSGSGWTNLPMGPGSNFVPERGESGPWSWMPGGAMAEVFSGGGLPANHHISTFVVWRAVRISELSVSGQIAPPVTQPPVTQPPPVVTPPVVTPPVTLPVVTSPASPPASSVSQRIGEWANSLNLSVRSLAERPDRDQALAGADVVYVLKDLFTTRDGSWEPSDHPGSRPDWAVDYLRPVGAPDYFDDAGADHHIFAAIIGLDGRYIPNYAVKFWSDGFDKLGDSTYQGYVDRETKDKSGWINIPIGPGSNFVPERGESGPWCWAPVGAADVVCGGGLPANQHVSTFAVWQAIARTDYDASQGGGVAVPTTPSTPATPSTPTAPAAEQDKKIFMPFFAAGPPSASSSVSPSAIVAAPVDEESVDEESVDEKSVDKKSVGEKSVDDEAVREDSVGKEAANQEAASEESESKSAVMMSRNAGTDKSNADEADLSDGALESDPGEANVKESEESTDFLRKAAWQRIGVEFDPNHQLIQYARTHNLGAPVTPEFDFEEYVVQGYQSGVVYMPKDQSGPILHTDW